MSLMVVRFVTGWAFFPFFSVSSPKKYNLTLFVVGVLTSILILLIFIFWSWSFCKSFICFQFYHSIQVHKYHIFPIWSKLFCFLFFFLVFYKSFIGFQFLSLIQINDIMFSDLVLIVLIFFLVCKSYYSFYLHPTIKTLFLFFMWIMVLICLTYFFSFAKLVFIFNFTLQSNKKLILFFNFDPHYFNCYFKILLNN